VKVFFDHSLPFFLAHGGVQVQIEQTKNALEKTGVSVDYVRWWEAAQAPDVIHYFGRTPEPYISMAHQKGIKIVTSDLHGGLGVRAPLARAVQKNVTRLGQKFLPEFLRWRFGWNAYKMSDACVSVTPWESRLIQEIFGAPREKCHVVPNGVEDVFFDSPETARDEWLVTTASILPVKRILETARAAVLAKTPYRVIGKPFSETDAYYLSFLALARANPGLLRYDGSCADRAELAAIYRKARGFVMLSRWESLSISALEAAACKCPILLSRLPWAESVFGDTVSYCSDCDSDASVSQSLRAFYDAAPTAASPVKPQRWLDVAVSLQKIYTSVCSAA